MAIFCVIPARLNSSRFPGKLLEKAAGKSILRYTFEQASKCPSIDGIFVATDNEQIAKHIENLGGNVIWTSSDCQNGTERISEALQKDPRLQKADYIVNLQGDHPCTHPSTITAIIQALKSDSEASMSTAVTKLHTIEELSSPHIVKCVFDTSLRALYFSRSPIPYHFQNQPIHAYGHIGIYCYKPEFLKEIFAINSTWAQKNEDLEQLKVLENGHKIKLAIVDETILGIDTPKDLEKFKEILCR
jgi:3-deoxy-manno-octulosonate cytidylyltransferase (CMP-KDO synthetase)